MFQLRLVKEQLFFAVVMFDYLRSLLQINEQICHKITGEMLL